MRARIMYQCRMASTNGAPAVGLFRSNASLVETAPSIPWFAAIQDIKSKKDLSGLAPKACFISAEAVEGVVGQIGEPQKATRELSGGTGSKFNRFRDGASERFCSIREVSRSGIAVETGRH
jgi:hypothetical protein